MCAQTRTFIVLSAIWVVGVVVFGAFYAFVLIGAHGFEWVPKANLTDDCWTQNCWPPAGSDGASDVYASNDDVAKVSPQANYYANIAIHWLTALFSYITLYTLPWRISNAVHLWGCCCTRRSCEEGFDFYGRPTKGIWCESRRAARRGGEKRGSCLSLSTLHHQWRCLPCTHVCLFLTDGSLPSRSCAPFGRHPCACRFHIPPKKRKPIVFLLCGNAFCQYATQACRFIWSSFDDSQVGCGPDHLRCQLCSLP